MQRLLSSIDNAENTDLLTKPFMREQTRLEPLRFGLRTPARLLPGTGLCLLTCRRNFPTGSGSSFICSRQLFTGSGIGFICSGRRLFFPLRFMHFPEFFFRNGSVSERGEISGFIHVEAVVRSEVLTGLLGHQFFNDRVDQVNIGLGTTTNPSSRVISINMVAVDFARNLLGQH